MSDVDVTRLGDAKALSAKRGRSFQVVFEAQDSDGDPIDLTGWTATGQIRKWLDDGPLLATFTCSIPDPLDGSVWVELAAADVTAMPSSGEYDIKLLTSSMVPIDLISGPFTVKGRVTP